MDKIIQVKDLTFRYDKDYVLKDLSFDVEKGDFVGVIGANGAGKSTLIKLILGQLKPTRGSISINGEDSVSLKSLGSLGYVAQVGQSRGMDFPAKVSEIVMMNMYQKIGMFKFAKKEHKEKVKTSLDIVRMSEYENKKFSDLSGGQQQRVVIAKAIVNDPEILILDEPTNGIDQESELILYDLLCDLNKNKNITIIMISHDLAKIKNHANKLVELKNNF